MEISSKPALMTSASLLLSIVRNRTAVPQVLETLRFYWLAGSQAGQGLLKHGVGTCGPGTRRCLAGESNETTQRKLSRID